MREHRCCSASSWAKIVDLLVALIWSAGLLVVSAEQVPHASFGPSFTEVDLFGNRHVKEGAFSVDGSTKVNKNFVRLTPDRQSKRGAVWADKPLGVSTFSTVVEFRISGQGDKFFGDGLALWIVHPDDSYGDFRHYDDYHDLEDDDASWRDYRWRPYHHWHLGEFHGYIEDFKGVGVVFDTYKNENMPHKDVTVLVNDGKTEHAELLKNAIGCDSLVRYHEQRDDFEAAKATTRAKLVVQGKRLELLLDAKNKGEFLSCVNVTLESFEDNWAEKAHLGFTASTGELSDNHDILRVDTYSDLAMAHHLEDERRRAPKYKVDEHTSVEERLTRAEKVINTLLDKMDMMEHHTEHDVVSIKDYVKTSSKKLRDQEADLEFTVETLDKKVKELEERLHGRVDQGITLATTAAAAWKLPFGGVLLLLLVAAGFAQRYYQKLRKSHLL